MSSTKMGQIGMRRILFLQTHGRGSLVSNLGPIFAFLLRLCNWPYLPIGLLLSLPAWVWAKIIYPLTT